MAKALGAGNLLTTCDLLMPECVGVVVCCENLLHYVHVVSTHRIEALPKSRDWGTCEQGQGRTQQRPRHQALRHAAHCHFLPARSPKCQCSLGPAHLPGRLGNEPRKGFRCLSPKAGPGPGATPHAQDGDPDADPTDAAQSFTSAAHTLLLCHSALQLSLAGP